LNVRSDSSARHKIGEQATGPRPEPEWRLADRKPRPLGARRCCNRRESYVAGPSEPECDSAGDCGGTRGDDVVDQDDAFRHHSHRRELHALSFSPGLAGLLLGDDTFEWRDDRCTGATRELLREKSRNVVPPLSQPLRIWGHRDDRIDVVG